MSFGGPVGGNSLGGPGHASEGVVVASEEGRSVGASRESIHAHTHDSRVLTEEERQSDTEVAATRVMAEPEKAKTVLGRFRALPPRKRVLLGFMGVMFSGLGLFLTDPQRQPR